MGHWLLSIGFFLFTFTSFQPVQAANCKLSFAPKYTDAIPGNTVRFEDRTYPELMYDNYAPNPGAVYMRPKGDRTENLAQAKKYVILLHGVGADFSNPNSMLHQYGNYTGTTGVKENGSSKSSYGKRQILSHEYFQEGIYAEILPLPGSTFGGKPFTEQGNGIHAVLKQIKIHIEEAKKFLPEGTEVVIHGRSYGATIGAAFAHQFPGVVDKLVLVGLATPRKDLMEQSHAAIKEAEERGKQGLGEKFEQNWPWIEWFDGIVIQSKWYDINKNKNLFGGAKALILIGEYDWQVVADERLLYADMDLKSSNVEFRLVPSAEHDATKTKYDSNKVARMGVYGNMMAFRFIFDQ